MGEYFRLEFRDAVFALVGELDLAAIDSFEDEVTQHLDDVDGGVVLELSQLSFVDATGLSSFVKFERQLRDVDRALVLRNPRPNVKRVLDVTGLTRLLERDPRRTETIAGKGPLNGVIERQPIGDERGSGSNGAFTYPPRQFTNAEEVTDEP